MQVSGKIKHVATTLRVALIDSADHLSPKATPTIAAGDFQVSIDGAALVNLVNLPAEAPAGSGIVALELTGGEMAGDEIVVRWTDQAGGEWDPGYVTVYTDGAAVLDDDLGTSLPAINSVREALMTARAIGRGTIETSGDLQIVKMFDRATTLFTRQGTPAGGPYSKLAEQGTLQHRVSSAAAVEAVGFNCWVGVVAEISAAAVVEQLGYVPATEDQVALGVVEVEGQNPAAYLYTV